MINHEFLQDRLDVEADVMGGVIVEEYDLVQALFREMLGEDIETYAYVGDRWKFLIYGRNVEILYNHITNVVCVAKSFTREGFQKIMSLDDKAIEYLRNLNAIYNDTYKRSR
jgi:hypothetical protein